MKIAAWLGEDKFPTLLNLTNTCNEADFTVTCLVYNAMDSP